MPNQMTIPINEPQSHVPLPPLALVASSLSGWDGSKDFATACPTLQSQDSLFEGAFEYGYLSMPEVTPPTLEYPSWSYGGDLASVDSDLQNNLNAYTLGLNDYGISGFDVAAGFHPPPF